MTRYHKHIMMIVQFQYHKFSEFFLFDQSVEVQNRFRNLRCTLK